MNRLRQAASRAGWRFVLGGAGAGLARAGVAALRGVPRLDRVNHRGETVSLAAGPALAVAASATAAAGAGSAAAGSAALVAGLGSGAVGYYDDMVGQRPEQRAAKGLGGHLTALRQGRLTSGVVKIGGIGGCALVAAALLGRARCGALDRPPGRGRNGPGIGRYRDPGRLADLVIDTGLIAGAANLANLFDLRPGRALKVGLAASGPLGAADEMLTGPAAAASTLLADDLGERVMLGDTGANAWGALLGLAAARRGGRAARVAMLAGVVGLTLASEKVSFTEVIESTPGLRQLDAWGRRTA